jgi:hypothetical protein
MSEADAAMDVRTLIPERDEGSASGPCMGGPLSEVELGMAYR